MANTVVDVDSARNVFRLFAIKPDTLSGDTYIPYTFIVQAASELGFQTNYDAIDDFIARAPGATNGRFNFPYFLHLCEQLALLMRLDHCGAKVRRALAQLDASVSSSYGSSGGAELSRAELRRRLGSGGVRAGEVEAILDLLDPTQSGHIDVATLEVVVAGSKLEPVRPPSPTLPPKKKQPLGTPLRNGAAGRRGGSRERSGSTPSTPYPNTNISRRQSVEPPSLMMSSGELRPHQLRGAANNNNNSIASSSNGGGSSGAPPKTKNRFARTDDNTNRDVSFHNSPPHVAQQQQKKKVAAATTTYTNGGGAGPRAQPTAKGKNASRTITTTTTATTTTKHNNNSNNNNKSRDEMEESTGSELPRTACSRGSKPTPDATLSFSQTFPTRERDRDDDDVLLMSGGEDGRPPEPQLQQRRRSGSSHRHHRDEPHLMSLSGPISVSETTCSSCCSSPRHLANNNTNTISNQKHTDTNNNNNNNNNNITNASSNMNVPDFLNDGGGYVFLPDEIEPRGSMRETPMKANTAATATNQRTSTSVNGAPPKEDAPAAAAAAATPPPQEKKKEKRDKKEKETKQTDANTSRRDSATTLPAVATAPPLSQHDSSVNHRDPWDEGRAYSDIEYPTNNSPAFTSSDALSQQNNGGHNENSKDGMPSPKKRKIDTMNLKPSSDFKLEKDKKKGLDKCCAVM